MKKLKVTLLFLLILVQLTYAQEITEVLNDSIKKYTIENCVNQFNMGKSIITKV